jgi:membrane-associated protein
MDTIQQFFEFILHIDKSLDSIISQYGTLTYLVLFAIVFAETGLVVTPFLPGDSLLFAAGALAARPENPLNVFALAGVFIGAAAVGDTTNYWIGRYIGPRVLRSEKSRFLNRKHLDHAHAFFEKYGRWALVLARFLPIVRTFMPFTAGVGAMPYFKFIGFSALGSLFWVGIFLFGGYLFGNIPVVRDNFAIVVLAIIAVSAAPAAVGVMRGVARARRAARAQRAATPVAPAPPAPNRRENAA